MATSGDKTTKSKFFPWHLRRLFPQSQPKPPQEVVEDDLVQGFENIGLKSNQKETFFDANSGGAVSGGDGSGGSSYESRSMQYPIRPDARDCLFYLKTGTCKYGPTCKFNHPLSVRKLVYQGKGKEEGCEGEPVKEPIPCKFYLATGFCKFGEACRFDHSISDPEISSPELNVVGLPIRPSERECSFYMRTGMCSFGAYCRFDHPNPVFVGESELYGSVVTGEYVEYLEGASEVPDGGYVLNFSESTQGYFSVPVITDNGFLYMNDDYLSGYQVPTCTQETTPSFAPSAENVKMVVDDNPPQGLPKREPCVLNDVGLPIRPGKKVCWHYESLGLCKLGRACPYDHPKKCSSTDPDGSTSESALDAKSQGSQEE